MARTRNIKPGFFSNEILGQADPLAALLFAGLWTLADRDGRLEDRPLRIKAAIFPYRTCDVDALLTFLATCEEPFIVRYHVEGKKYIQILKFSEHQNPHIKETSCNYPAPDKHCASTVQEPDKPGLKPSPNHLVPSPEDDDEPTRQRKLIEEATGWDDDPNWMGNYSRLTVWLESGHDFDLDILPAIQQVMHKRKGQGPPSSLNYFEKAVANAKATRLKPMPEGKPNAKSSTSSSAVDAIYAGFATAVREDAVS